jgi:hypothetical protein
MILRSADFTYFDAKKKPQIKMPFLVRLSISIMTQVFYANKARGNK